MNKQKKLRIVIVEDNNELRDILASGLRHFGHHVIDVCDGSQLDAALSEFCTDIIILDLSLPGEDGISIAVRLRRQYKNLGIVMVTARGRVEERVIGLETGADLYFVKPVDLLELESSLRSLHRRITAYQPSPWCFKPKTSTLTTPNNGELSLTAQECILICTLVKRPGENVPRSEIFKALNQPDDLYGDRRLEAMISRLRAKLKAIDPPVKLPIRARHNLGYAFLADIEITAP